jgi:DNA-binding GntR family transcriptional regulator
VTDTAALIRVWRASPRRLDTIAADLATKISAGQLHRWAQLPSQAALADEYGVSERLITSAKHQLAACGFLTSENGRYYVA